MKVSFDINSAEDASEAGASMFALAQAMGATPAAAAPAPAPAAAAAAAPAPAPAAAAPAAPAPAPAAPAPAPAAAAPAAAQVPQADFSAAVQNYARANNPKAAKAKLAEFGFAKTSDVPPERYAELMAALAV